MLWTVPFFMGERTHDLAVPLARRDLVPDLPAGTQQTRMGALYRALAAQLAEVGFDPAPVIVAGDCVATTGVLAALQQRGVDPVLVWFDAHGDFHTWETTPSRFIGGMPLAMVTGRGEQAIVEAAGAHPVSDADVWLVGARDLDPGEDAALERSGVTLVPVAEVAGAVPDDRPLYLHVDADVVDPAEMPAMNYPAPGGPSLAEVGDALAGLAATGRVHAVSFSVWNPALPGADRASAAVAELIGRAAV